MMLFASSNKLKLENIKLEISEIQNVYRDLFKDPPWNLLDSLKSLNSGLKMLEKDVNIFLYKYERINEMLRQIDVVISDYYNVDTEISLYELNGMEKDLFDVKEEYGEIKMLKLNVDKLKKGLNEEIDRLSS